MWPCAQLALGIGAAIVYLLFIKEATAGGMDGASKMPFDISSIALECIEGSYIVVVESLNLAY